MTALSFREISAARVMIWGALCICCIRWSLWGMITDQPWYIRAIVGALIGGFLLAAIPAAFSWIKGQSGKANAAQTPSSQPTVINNTGNCNNNGTNSGIINNNCQTIVTKPPREGDKNNDIYQDGVFAGNISSSVPDKQKSSIIIMEIRNADDFDLNKSFVFRGRVFRVIKVGLKVYNTITRPQDGVVLTDVEAAIVAN